MPITPVPMGDIGDIASYFDDLIKNRYSLYAPNKQYALKSRTDCIPVTKTNKIWKKATTSVSIQKSLLHSKVKNFSNKLRKNTATLDKYTRYGITKSRTRKLTQTPAPAMNIQ